MMRVLLFIVLVAVLAIVASCRSPEKRDADRAMHRLRCGDRVPPAIAREVDGKVVREGVNQIGSFPTGRVYAVVVRGELDSLILEEKGEQPVKVVMRMPDPAPNPPGPETPQSCDQKFDNCIADCESASDPQCCRYKCFFEWTMCTNRSGGSLSGGITMY